MFAQKLKQSCKFISVSLGFLSSYFSYQYQQTAEKNVDKTFLQNFQLMQQWVKGKSLTAFNCTETYLLQYLQKLSKSPLFHQMDVASLLIFFANSQNLMVHDLFVKFLSVLNFPDDVDMKYYIDQCNLKTLIGLARSQQFDVKWFDQSKEKVFHIEYDCDEAIVLHIQENLNKLFDELNDTFEGDPSDLCIRSMFDQVKYMHLPDDPVLNVMVDLCTERDNLNFTNPKKLLFEEHVFKYLDILRRYSNKEAVISSKRMVERFILILQNILFLYSESEDIAVSSGNILANLAMKKDNHELISGFIPLLMKWKLGSKNSLKIVADRVLHNLDDKVNDFVPLGDGVYILHPNQREKDELNIDIVFVHGISGSPFYTWRQNKASGTQPQTDCWPKDWLPADYPNARILSIQYDTSLSEWLLACPFEKEKYSLDKQAERLREKLHLCGLGKRPVMWVAHSMGGLIVKKLILSENNSDIVSATKGIVFYSVPHLGSPIATKSEKAGFILFPSVEVSELSEESKNLRELHKKFSKFVDWNNVRCVDIGESKPLTLPYIKLKSFVVPRSSSDVGYGRYILVDSNHQDVCKPVTRVDVRYTEVVKMINSMQKRYKK